MPKIDMGLGQVRDACFKHKFRWMFTLKANNPNPEGTGVGVSAIIGIVDALPPTKAARPNLTFKEVTAQHLTETIYFPSKPEWRPINVTVYDTAKSVSNPVFLWIKQIYNSQTGVWSPPANPNVITTASLSLYDGCGNEVEKWTYEDVWPQTIEFGELDMSTNDIVYIDLTLRYSRAYLSF